VTLPAWRVELALALAILIAIALVTEASLNRDEPAPPSFDAIVHASRR
jgi:hypothetical protein